LYNWSLRRLFHPKAAESLPKALQTSMVHESFAVDRPTPSVSRRNNYLPGSPPCCAIAAFCSWNLSPNRCDPFMCLSTHRMTQLSSREVRDLLSKPLTQLSKQFWTRLEYI
jgi:hypothetical protein